MKTELFVHGCIDCKGVLREVLQPVASTELGNFCAVIGFFFNLVHLLYDGCYRCNIHSHFVLFFQYDEEGEEADEVMFTK